MDTRYKIIGHGLAGCVLALTFYKKKIPFHLFGCTQAGEASMASSGLIAPITGRRYVKAWMIDLLIDKAIEFYGWTESLLDKKYFFPVDIIRFLSNPEAIAAWERRLDDEDYRAYISGKRFPEMDQSGRKYGIVTGGYRLDTQRWLHDVRKFLIGQNLLTITGEPIVFDHVDNHILIYATGAIGSDPGIIPNKGEALLVRMHDWKWTGIIKEKVYFIPAQEKDVFWVGSTYEPWPDNPDPTEENKKELIKAISDMHHGGFEVIDHFAGIRPTVDDRRPLIGPFPFRPGSYMFNGMGTKGTSLAPYWGEELISMIVENKPLPDLVDPARYAVTAG